MTWVGKIQQYISEITAAGPWWLAQQNIGAFLESVAATLDGSVDALHGGLKGTQPLRCDPSLLPTISRDRSLRIYQSEPEESQRYRLSQWLQLHRQRGTHQGEMRNLQPYFLDQPGLPRIRIVHQSGTGARATWHTLNHDSTYDVHKQEPSNWDWDGQPELWSRWWAIIYTDGTFLSPDVTFWNGGQLWNGGTYWDGIESQVMLDLIAMLIDWKSAHSRCAGVCLARDPDKFDPTATPVTYAGGQTSHPTGNWHRLVDPTTGLPTREPTGSWIYDVYRT